MELWFTEKQTPDLGITCAIKGTLHREKSAFQDIAVLDTLQFGRMLVLDGMVMTTEKDEFVYHEMISHVPLFTHPNPERVLVVGGGDGGAIREILKHQKVKEAVLAEIDGRVIEVCKQFLPSISAGLAEPRVKIQVSDGIQHVKEHENYYDVILVDSTEPIGPAEGLFAKEFYRSIHRALRADGIMAAQTESPFVNADLIKRVFHDIKEHFAVTRLYQASIPTYPSGLWTFTLGSKKYDPLQAELSGAVPFETKYYNFDLHRGAFMLPEMCRRLTELG
ncbi:MAG: polyamine aminopropyltransferase [Bacillota bacterium]